MDKKTILAIVLSAIILIGYYGFLYKPPQAPSPQSKPSVAEGTETPVKPEEESPVSFPSELPASPPSAASAPTPTAPMPEASSAPIVTQTVETPKVEAQLSSKSGFALHWWLKEFFNEADEKGGHTDLLQGTENEPPLGLLLYPGKSAVYPVYTLEEETGLQGPQPSARYRASLRGLQVEQELHLGEQAYAVELQVKLTNQSPQEQVVAPGLRLMVPQKKNAKSKSGGGFLSRFGQRPDVISPLYRLGTKVEREQKLDKLGVYQEAVGEIAWTGLEGRYFMRALLARRLSPQNRTAYGVKGPWVYSDLQYPAETLAAGESKTFAFTLYLGPKDPTYLNAFASSDLGAAINYGWFGVIARPILIGLKLFHSFLGNWGLAIILLTIVIKLLFYPLTRKSMASMKGMQQLQPELKKIREKFKDDRERLNMETMNLFKRHKVNPMGGCLPMVLQMPIYIALYKVLYTATELYHAPFFWFYRDLSAPDPYYILPILLGISMVAQQRMTPSTGDPTQAKMMMFMPILFSVFMLFLPLGLVLYIFVNTVMTVMQQYMHQHDITFRGLLKGSGKSAKAT